MPSNSAFTKIDVTQLVQDIRQQISRRSEESDNHRETAVGLGKLTASIPSELRASLHAAQKEIDAFSSQIEAGEPQPESLSFLGQIGVSIRRRLYRLLWWHSYQLKTLAALMSRRSHEDLKLLEILSQIVPEDGQIQELRRQGKESESRLRRLESAQLKLQAAEVERSVRVSVTQQDEASLRRELIEIRSAFNSWRSEASSCWSRLRQELNEVKSAIAEADVPLSEKTLTEYAKATQTIEELAKRVKTDTAQRNHIAVRLSELGLLSHQVKESLSAEDRRLALFVQEARKRLSLPFTDDELHDMLKRHTDDRYDSLYAALEDVFRGSREELKARQNVYLSLLREREIGSPIMPILDLGCGRGEWLGLLRDVGLHARGIDRHEAMVESCRTAGLDVIQGDAPSFLSTLPDACLGAVTLFHMIEHQPIDVTLTLIDEALRVLKTGGTLIVETSDPQNVLVGIFDPTGLKPLPSPMLRFLVEARGFCSVQVRELHPYPESFRCADDPTGTAMPLSDYLYGPQDYAVIAQKP
jgi:O-antigen chain-terminating methyltransferase